MACPRRWWADTPDRLAARGAIPARGTEVGLSRFECIARPDGLVHLSELAAILCVAVICGLFFLARDRAASTSSALWVPVLWLMIGGSRNLSEWLHLGSPAADDDRYLTGNPVDRNVLTAFLLIGVLVLVRRRREAWAFVRVNSAVMAYFAYCAVSILWSDYPDVALKRWFRGAGDLVMVLIVLTEPNRLAAAKRLLNRVGFVFMPLSILVIRYYPLIGRAYSRHTGAASWTGVATDKNGLGMICMVFGLSSLWQILEAVRGGTETGRARGVIAHGAVVAMAMWLLVKADSATAISCFALAGGTMVLTQSASFGRRPRLVHLLVAAVVGVPLAAMVLQSSGLLSVIGRDATFTGRTEIWRRAIGLVPNSLTGAGYESFWLGARLDAMADLNRPNQAHNGYLEVFLNLGWFGVLSIAAVMATCYRRVTSAIRRHEDASTIRLAYFLTVAMYNFSEGAFKMMSPVWVLFLLATTMLPVAPVGTPAPVYRPRVGSRRKDEAPWLRHRGVSRYSPSWGRDAGRRLRRAGEATLALGLDGEARA